MKYRYRTTSVAHGHRGSIKYFSLNVFHILSEAYALTHPRRSGYGSSFDTKFGSFFHIEVRSSYICYSKVFAHTLTRSDWRRIREACASSTADELGASSYMISFLEAHHSPPPFPFTFCEQPVGSFCAHCPRCILPSETRPRVQPVAP